jgi:precorrin-6Y C5,15-methyltransferase (decarboxylating)
VQGARQVEERSEPLRCAEVVVHGRLKTLAVSGHFVEQDLVLAGSRRALARKSIGLLKEAPEALQRIPQDPDAIFIGGTAGEMQEILKVCRERLKPRGRLVVNLVTLENLGEAVQVLKKIGFKHEVTLVQISRSKPILDLTRFDALNPVFVVSGIK